MPHPFSALGLAHTLLSAVPVIAGLLAVVRSGRIDPSSVAGRLYLGGLVVSVATSFGLSSTGGLNAGHVLGVLALLAVGAGLVAPRLSFLGRAREYLGTFAWSFSFFLLLVPGISETLRRLPADAPFAADPQDPVVARALLAWLAAFLVGFALQARAIRRRAAGRHT